MEVHQQTEKKSNASTENEKGRYPFQTVLEGLFGTSGLECDLGNSIATLHPQVMRYDVG
jgi:hypothetical protein